MSILAVDKLQSVIGNTINIADGYTLSGSVVPNSGILQIQQTVFANTYASTGVFDESTFYSVDVLDCTITPKAANSKFFVMLQAHIGIDYFQWSARLRRNSNNQIALGSDLGTNRFGTSAVYNFYDASGSTGTEAQYQIRPLIVNYLDSPEQPNTAPITYGIDIKGYSDTYALYINRSKLNTDNPAGWDDRPISTMTVWEIAE
jgi:hypothetical protein